MQLLWLVVGFLGVASFQSRGFAVEEHWVTTWGCAPQLTEPRNLPPTPLTHNTLRQFVRTTLPGKQLRIRFSNAFGNSPVTLDAAHLAMAAGAGSAGSGEINPATDRALKFVGKPSVIIPPGEFVMSDPLEFNLTGLAEIAISVHFEECSATAVTGHPGSRTTSFIQSGDGVAMANLPQAAKTQHWYLITGVEVRADAASQALVVLGDSITDGRGSTTDGNDRWPDQLARRLLSNAPTAGIAVVNMGIGGNAIFGGLGPAAVNRFERDVLNQAGVRYLIVFEGVNDIGGDHSAAPTLATNLISAYTRFAREAHVREILVYGATITPFGGNGYFSTAHEAARQRVNAWIRTNFIYDGVIDFDAVTRDPATLTNLLTAYDTGDHLHLNPAGYKAMAESIDMRQLTPSSSK